MRKLIFVKTLTNNVRYEKVKMAQIKSKFMKLAFN